MNSIKHVAVECRSRIRSAHFFVELSMPFKGSVVLDVGTITLKTNEKTTAGVINVKNLFEIQVDSLSLYESDGSFLSFRVSTGSNDNHFYAEAFQPVKHISSSKYTIDINIRSTDTVQFFCQKCKNTLTIRDKFEKLRELPSEHLSMDEWLCACGHRKTESDKPVSRPDGAVTNASKLAPKRNMLLYGSLFVVLSPEVVYPAAMHCLNGLMICQKCQTCLGEAQNGAVKLWNDTVNIERNNVSKQIFSLPMDAPVFLLHRAIREFSISQLPMHQVFFFAKFPKNEFKYLMVKVSEKLLVLATSDPTNLSNLVKRNTSKLQFRSQHQDDATHLTEADDPLIFRMEMSQAVFCDTLKMLNDNSRFIPQVYRRKDDFLYSYVFLNY